MKILAIEHEITPIDPIQSKMILAEEAQRVWDLYQEGIIREIYFHQKNHTAVLILECADEISASDILATLPLVQQNMIKFEMMPLIPYSGFERLFSKQKMQ